MKYLRLAVPLLILCLVVALAGNALRKWVRDHNQRSAAEDAARHTLIVGTWKEAASGDVYRFLPDDSFTAVWNLDDTVSIDEPKGILTHKDQYEVHGNWRLSGDKVKVTIRGVDRVDVHDVQLSAPEYKEKYGADKLEEMRQAIAGKMAESMKKAISDKIVGLSDSYTIISLNDRQWIAKDPDGTTHTRLRSD